MREIIISSTLLSHATLKAGAAAAALSLLVAGGAYASVQAEAPSVASLTETQARISAIGEATASATGTSSGVTVSGQSTTVSTQTSESAQPHGSVTQESADLPQGEQKVGTAGVDGIVRTTYQVTTVNGQEVSRVAVSSVVVTPKVDEVILVGTYVAPTTTAATSTSTGSSSSTSAASSSSSAVTYTDDGSLDDDFARIAQCESGGNPTTNTGNGYYGMYQFSLSTWQSVGGTGLPSDASAEEQLMRAKILQARSGWGQWGCSH